VDDGTIPSTEDTVLLQERDRAVAEALASSASDDRTAILMAAHGYRSVEIASLLGRTELASRTLLCRARGRLRAQLVLAEAI